ncbi:DUF421 domain-containing protein [Verticiella sediminum]|uniref:DUF421 domain-containing protein n=1 Tax=Verticiella sediminum TaxID=1247510 RepID=A0A556AZG9_9BURK|nr:YetF domain-containing protein [Verticiella sediminum]TSH98329.1 DUF421 domain-containing protein [Verticiella sediminum]
MPAELAAILYLDSSPLEMVLRGTVMYWAIFILLRLAGRRDLGTVGVADLVVVMLVADAAGNALASSDDSTLLSGITVVATIVFWSIIVDRLGYYSPRVRRWLEPGQVLLVKDGEILRAGLRKEYLTEDELLAELRAAGVGDLDEVHRAYIEADGRISVIRRHFVGKPKRPTY